eukprot:3740674-Amphidinium_carterae.1
MEAPCYLSPWELALQTDGRLQCTPHWAKKPPEHFQDNLIKCSLAITGACGSCEGWPCGCQGSDLAWPLTSIPGHNQPVLRHTLGSAICHCATAEAKLTLHWRRHPSAVQVSYSCQSALYGQH